MIDELGQIAQTDFSLWALFFRADWVVKAVMIGLVLTSIICWSIIFQKLRQFYKFRRVGLYFPGMLIDSESFGVLWGRLERAPAHPIGKLMRAAYREWRDAKERQDKNIETYMRQVIEFEIDRAIERLQSRMIFIASVGAVSPFVGLFGTVWGIMNSFQAIAQTQDTNLAVVAPGIAEALFATGLGLLAAIPAVLFYNKFTNDIRIFTLALERFGHEFGYFLGSQKGKV